MVTEPDTLFCKQAERPYLCILFEPLYESMQLLRIALSKLQTLIRRGFVEVRSYLTAV